MELLNVAIACERALWKLADDLLGCEALTLGR